MEAKTNYTAVGLGVVILGCALLASALWLSMGFDKKNYAIYTVYIREAVSGLNLESPVKYNGVPVGYVHAIKLDPDNPQQVALSLYIEEGTPITQSTIATLIAQGITGNTYVGLSATSPDLVPLKKPLGEPYPVIPSKPSLLNQLDHVLKQVSENINKLSLRMNKVLDDENTKNLKKTLRNMKKFTEVLANEAKGLTKEIHTVGESISTTMQAGEKAIHKISGQALPPAVDLLHKLNKVADNLDKVSRELRQNPSILLRGAKPPKPGPGER